MKRPTHVYHIDCQLGRRKRQSVELQLSATRRSKHGALTVHGFSVMIDGQNIMAWSTASLVRKEAKFLP